jgi:hypothetical protein
VSNSASRPNLLETSKRHKSIRLGCGPTRVWFTAGRVDYSVVVLPSFVSDHKRLLSQWHPTRNGSLSPQTLPDYSTRSVWWRCSRGPDHKWRTCPKNRQPL